ncbi:MAG: CPBP family intramembrane glutamic endopeptidase [Anaerolineae bacterium]
MALFVRVVVYYVLMWVFLIILGGTSQAVGLPVEVGVAQWGPGIAALLMLLIFRKDGLRLTLVNPDTPFSRYVLAFAVPLALSAVIYGVSRLLPPTAAPSAWAVVTSLPMLLIWIPFGALGEEIGWRGYLQIRLDVRLNGFTSSLIVAALWAPMHIHLFSNGLLYIALFFITLMGYSLVLYALLHDTGFSVLIATVFHLAINYGNLLYFDVLNAPSLMLISALVWGIAAGVTVYQRRAIFFGRPERAPTGPIGAVAEG